MPRPDVALGDRHDQPQVGLDEAALGVVAVVGERLQARGLGGVEGAEPARGVELGQLDRRLDAGLDALGQRHLLGRDQQRAPGRSRAGTCARDRTCPRRRARPRGPRSCGRGGASWPTGGGRPLGPVSPSRASTHGGVVVVELDLDRRRPRRRRLDAGSRRRGRPISSRTTPAAWQRAIDLGEHLGRSARCGAGHARGRAGVRRPDSTCVLDRPWSARLRPCRPMCRASMARRSSPVPLPGPRARLATARPTRPRFGRSAGRRRCAVSSAEIGQRLRTVRRRLAPRQPQIGDVAPGDLR